MHHARKRALGSQAPDSIPISPNTPESKAPKSSKIQVSIQGLRFGIIGVGGYVAPRHLKAIKDIGGELVCAYDVRDCVGIMDSYFPEAEFFTKEREFCAFLTRLNAAGTGLDFIAICSPNYLHLRHIALALEHGASAICEKPLVLHARHIHKLTLLESRAQSHARQNPDSRACPRVYGILQLRLHEQIIALRQRMQTLRAKNTESSFYDLELRYISARGKWYAKSWKGDVKKSGGIVCNIGVHLFDMLLFVFGEVIASRVERLTPTRASGVLEFANARVRWLLSIDACDLAGDSRALRVLESIPRSGDLDFGMGSGAFAPVEFSQGFENLHTASYAAIAQGLGFGLGDIAPAISLIEQITKQS